MLTDKYGNTVLGIIWPRGMVKQCGLRQSNQKELIQKGTNIKDEAVTKSIAAGAAQ